MPDPIEGNPTTPAVEAGKTFSQADLDRLIGERLTREREQSKAQLADLEAYKAKAAKLDALESANQSEAEKVAKAIADRDTRLADMEARAAAAEQRATEYVRQAKIVAAASMLNAYDAADPNFAAATAAIDPSDPKADGQIKTALESLKASKPYLFRPPGGRLETFNPAGPSGEAETDAQRAHRVQRSAQGAGKGMGPLG